MAFDMLKEERKKLQKEIKDKTIGYILAAFGLVAGLAWNEAIKSLITVFFPGPGNDVVVKFVYAFIITIIVVLITVYLLRVNQDKKP